MESISNSMTDDDLSLPIDFNMTTQIPRVMEGTSTSMNESMPAGKFSEVHTIKDHEMHISELKKENFELKLRIYFLEEKLQNSQRDVDDNDTFKMNIELKVEIEKLKNELNEKRRLLLKASNAVESLDRNNQEQIKKLRDRHIRDLDEVKESYNMKLKANEEVLKIASEQSEQFRNKLVEAERINQQIKEGTNKNGCSTFEATEMQAKLQASLREKDRIIDELKSAVDVRESRIKLLSQACDPDATEQVKGLKQKIEERDRQISDLGEKLKNSEASIKDLKGSLYENDRKLQLALQDGNSSVQKLNEKLRLKQVEAEEMQEKFRILQQNLEKAQDIIDEASLKDVEAFEEKSKALKAKDALIAELQGNLKQKEMENDHLTRSLARKDIELQRINERNGEQDDTANQMYAKEKELTALSEELTNIRNKLREAWDQHEEQVQKLNRDHQTQVNAKDQIIQRVTETLEDKESIIQDLIVTQENLSLSSSRDDITDTKEELIQKLRNRLEERDAAVEANIEEKFKALHKKEEEIQELRKSLRERDRLIENINAAVLNNEDVVKNLQSTLREKATLIDSLKANQQIQESQFEEANEIALKKSRENEGLIEKLKRNLANREQQIENLQNVLHRHAAAEVKDSEETELVNLLGATLKEKEKLVAELLTERSTMMARFEANNQKMMSTLAGKEHLLKDMSAENDRICSEKNDSIARLQQQIHDLNLNIQGVENSKLWMKQEHEILLGKLKQSLEEKDRTIEKLIKTSKEKDKVFLKLQECTSNKTSPVRLEMTNLTDKVNELEKLLHEKEDIVTELERVVKEQEMSINEKKQEYMECVSEFEHELEEKDLLLKQATETIEAFQAKLNNLPVLEELKRNLEQTKNAFNKSEMERKKVEADYQSNQEQQLEQMQMLENEVTSLRQQKESWSLQRENIAENKSRDQVSRLEDLLQQQIDETSRLFKILKEEREGYENVLKQSSYSASIDLSGDLKLVSQLRRSLEEGIVENNKLRAQLKENIAQSSENEKPHNSQQQDEIERLHAKLEDSERWNRSLQSRLDAMQPRGGVSGSTGSLGMSGTMFSTRQSGNMETVPGSPIEEIKSRLNESQKMNTKLREQLQKTTEAGAEAKAGLNQLNEQQKHEIVLLRQELKKVNKSCDDLRVAAKKSEAELSSYKNEHDIEFNTLKRALEDSQKFNKSLKERLKEGKEHKEIQTSLTSKSLPNDSINVSQLQMELTEKTQMVESLTKKLQRIEQIEAGKISFASSDDGESSVKRESSISPKTAQIRKLQNDLEEKQRMNEALLQDRTSQVSHLEKELAESHNTIQTLRYKLEIDNENKQHQTSFDIDKASMTTPHDFVDGTTSPDEQRSKQVERLQKELEEVYKKNEDLRKTVSDNIGIVDLNRKLKNSLAASEQKGGVLTKELQNYTKKLEDSNIEVSRLTDELAETRSINSGHVAQLKDLHRQQEQATKFREEALSARSMNEKLSAEVKRLFSSLENALKENEKLSEALSNSKRQEHSPKDAATSPVSRNLFNDSPRGSRTHLSLELQSLREKLILSEKLNTALKYELEANKRFAKSGSSDEPLMHHLEELRQLRSRLEESIKTYDDLCVQLEEKLKELGEGEGEENVLKESMSLVKDNESLRLQIRKLNEEFKLIQQQLEDHRLTRKRDKEQITLLNSHLIESNKANESLRNELAICDSVIKLSQKSDREEGSESTSSNNNDAIMLLLAEIRSLREQLETSIQSNNSLRQMLQKQLSSSPQRETVRSPEHAPSRTSPLLSPILDRSKSLQRSPVEKDRSLALESQSLQELRQYINSSFQSSETVLVKIMRITLEDVDSSGKLDELKKDLESLRSLLFKSVKLLDHLWAEHLSSGPSTTDKLTKQNDELRKEITLLKKRVLSQSKILENTATRLESSSRMRKEVERSLFARLSETRDTLGISRKHLEDHLASRNGN
ncbi:myomegalin-like [Dendronephthya gigantea]|uniref:myomegalin-like n=1 Tax=Dendronephthya gigantea TaxID=151771 RepID=UPI001069F36D|nr:myomegalin-like [Dendronephthya gigantea]